MISNPSEKCVADNLLNKVATLDQYNEEADPTILEPLEFSEKLEILKKLSAKPNVYALVVLVFTNCEGITFNLIKKYTELFSILSEKERIEYSPELYQTYDKVIF